MSLACHLFRSRKLRSIISSMTYDARLRNCAPIEKCLWYNYQERPRRICSSDAFTANFWYFRLMIARPLDYNLCRAKRKIVSEPTRADTRVRRCNQPNYHTKYDCYDFQEAHTIFKRSNLLCHAIPTRYIDMLLKMFSLYLDFSAAFVAAQW